MSIETHLEHAAQLIHAMAASPDLHQVDAAVAALVAALGQNKPLLVCGNGGSAADAMHIAGELVGRFLRERRGFPVICLADNPVVLTAWSNDYSYETVFARQVQAYGQAGGVVWGISTSGNSANVVAALKAAKAQHMLTIGMTGAGGGNMAAVSDILLTVPSAHTPDIQQVHICLYHYICQQVEEALAVSVTPPPHP